MLHAMAVISISLEPSILCSFQYVLDVDIMEPCHVLQQLSRPYNLSGL